MATQSQIAANQLNAQLSTGPTSKAGLEASSRNSIVHGFTGKKFFVKPGEGEAYHKHVEGYFKEYKPDTHKETAMVQQLADMEWSLHQMFVEQNNIIALMETISQQENPIQAGASLARTLNTLSLYENRRRRAVKALEAEILALQEAAAEQLESDLAKAAPVYKSHKAQGKPFDPAAFGFACSLDDLREYLNEEQAATKANKGQSNAAQAKVIEDIQKIHDENARELKEIDAAMGQLLKQG